MNSFRSISSENNVILILSHSRLCITRYSSSSTDLAAILQEQSLNFEKKSTKTIAFETFVQTPAEFVANSLVNIHDSLALPWWATIALATVAFRAVVGASITIAQQRFIERLQIVRRNVTSELEPRIKVLNVQAMKGKTATILEERKNLKREVRDSFETNKTIY
jgi:membrane protein insertase Oxa1/YidC/SpoIIIJ